VATFTINIVDFAAIWEELPHADDVIIPNVEAIPGGIEEGAAYPAGWDEIFINVSAEWMYVPPGVAIAGYNIGKKWKAFPPEPAKWAKILRKLFRKGGNLQLTNAMSGKNLASEAFTLKFPKLEPCPPKVRAAVNYLQHADDSFMTAGAWTLHEKVKPPAYTPEYIEDIQIVRPFTGKKLTPVDYIHGGEKTGWRHFAALRVETPPPGGKGGLKTVYWLRIGAAALENGNYIAGSKPSKVAPLSLLKPPSLKVKNGRISPKKFQALNFGRGWSSAFSPEAAKAAKKTLIPPTDVVSVRLSASPKKPASLVQYFSGIQLQQGGVPSTPLSTHSASCAKALCEGCS